MTRWLVVMLAVSGMVLGLFQAVGSSQGDTRSLPRPDLIEIRAGLPAGDQEMPAVHFMHDRHTKAVGESSCASCHSKAAEKTVFRFKRTGPLAPQAAKTHYHDNCLTCHRETLAAGKPSGPLAADCRACHRKDAPESNWAALAFDPSLHYRHEQAQSIRPFGEKDNCGSCHHVLDPKTEKTVPAKGKEGSCRYCHKPEKTVDKETNRETRAMQNAAHDSCVACHQNLTVLKMKGGPITCAGCHDSMQQAKIEKVAQVPRMQRNQPDAAILATRLKRAVGTGKETAAPIAAVAFDHRSHEKAVGSCRSCHHASLESCAACHTPVGDPKGNFIRLEQAMHLQRGNASCISCHNQAKTAAACAGCHAQMPAKNFSDADCRVCHNLDLKSGDLALKDKEIGARQAADAVTARTRPLPTVAKADIPETVEIKAMADQYETAKMPHGKIIRAIYDNLGDSRMARYFHQEPATLCQGCHHNSPPSVKPPGCASCHGAPFTDEAEGRPGLMGAYHGQCMGCHEKMGIEKPAANDCTACHKKRATTLVQGTNTQ
ncbi:MAG: cytochrome c3 family protein [Desulfobacterales bacterium]|nr:cytochrome c3 family protein [Desulfobacterales bacterium]